MWECIRCNPTDFAIIIHCRGTTFQILSYEIVQYLKGEYCPWLLSSCRKQVSLHQLDVSFLHSWAGAISDDAIVNSICMYYRHVGSALGLGKMGGCYDWFSSPVGTENRGGSEVKEILTAAHQEFGGCAHRCVGKPKRREQDRADPRRRGCARSGTAEG